MPGFRPTMCWSPPVRPARCSSSRPRLLSQSDHLVVVRPNYATNIETPKAIGCAISYIDLEFDEGFAIDLDKVEAALSPEHALHQRHLPAQPDRHHAVAGRSRRADRAGRAPRLPSAGRRDLSRPQLWPEAAGRRSLSAAGDQRLVAVEGVRHPRHPHRLAGHPGCRALRAVPRRQGADRHLRQRHRRSHCAHHAGAPRRFPGQADARDDARGATSCRTGSTPSRWSIGCGPKAASSASPASTSARISISTASTESCSNGTAPMSAPATGSTCRSGSSASASAGRRWRNSRAGWKEFRRRCGSRIDGRT